MLHAKGLAGGLACAKLGARTDNSQSETDMASIVNETAGKQAGEGDEHVVDFGRRSRRPLAGGYFSRLYAGGRSISLWARAHSENFVVTTAAKRPRPKLEYCSSSRFIVLDQRFRS